MEESGGPGILSEEHLGLPATRGDLTRKFAYNQACGKRCHAPGGITNEQRPHVAPVTSRYWIVRHFETH